MKRAKSGWHKKGDDGRCTHRDPRGKCDACRERDARAVTHLREQHRLLDIQLAAQRRYNR